MNREGPDFWLHDTGPLLRPAVTSFICGEPLNHIQIAAIKAYLRRWMAAPWRGPNIDKLRADVETIRTKADLDRFYDHALQNEIDPF